MTVKSCRAPISVPTPTPDSRAFFRRRRLFDSFARNVNHCISVSAVNLRFELRLIRVFKDFLPDFFERIYFFAVYLQNRVAFLQTDLVKRASGENRKSPRRARLFVQSASKNGNHCRENQRKS